MQRHSPTPKGEPLPQRPVRALLTDRLLYTWEWLRPVQRDQAWEMVESMRTTRAAEQRAHRLISLLVLLALVVASVLVYGLLLPPAH